MHDVRDFHHGQMDAVYYAYHPETEKHVGYLSYTLYEGVARISWIGVDEKFQRCGVGRTLVCALVAEYGWDKVDWGFLTGQGVKFKRAMTKLCLPC